MNTVLRYHIGISLLLSFVAFTCAVVCGAKAIPGGPFVSFRGDIPCERSSAGFPL